MFDLFYSKAQPPVTFNGGFSKEQKNFLESADLAYTLTIKQKDMRHFSRYASSDAFTQVSYTLSYERSWVGVSDKFKNVTWTLIEVNKEGSMLARKEAVFSKVKVTKSLKLKVAEDFTELWGIVKGIDNYIVEKIINIDGGF